MNLLAKALANAEPHPIVSAVQFAHLTRTTGGATMNARTGEFTEIGTPNAYAIARPRSEVSHRRPRTMEVDSIGGGDVDLSHVLQERSRVRRLYPNRSDVNVGSWHNEDTGKIEFDPSEVHRGVSLDEATAEGRKRHELAVFDFKNGQSVPTGFRRGKS